jgi:hypothetical protein
MAGRFAARLLEALVQGSFSSVVRNSFLVSLLVLGCSSDGSSPDELGSDGAVGGGGSGGTTGGKGGSANGGKGGAGAGPSTGGASGTKATGGKGGTPSAAGKPNQGSGGDAGEAGSDDGGKGGGSGGANAATGGSSATSGSAGQIGNHTNPLTQPVIDAFVAAHNAARARKDLDPAPNPELPPVTWDAVLADSAYNYLSQCVVDGDLVAHNDDRTGDYAALGGVDYVGENIYASTGNMVEPSDAVDSWMMEKNQYDYDQDGFSAAGHYTQVVWRASVRIGCAIVNCPNARFNNTVLCDYAPGGNISGQKPY